MHGQVGRGWAYLSQCLSVSENHELTQLKAVLFCHVLEEASQKGIFGIASPACHDDASNEGISKERQP